MTDYQLNIRFEEIKKEFKKLMKKTNRNYIEFNGYYMELKYNDKSRGIRWFHRSKYVPNFVVSHEDFSPAINIAGFNLFTKFDDAILKLVLLEDTWKRYLKRKSKIGEKLDIKEIRKIS